MKILKVLKRNFYKSVAILLCLTLIFSNSLVTLANTNFGDQNTETSEAIEEEINEELEEQAEEEAIEGVAEKILKSRKI